MCCIWEKTGDVSLQFRDFLLKHKLNRTVSSFAFRETFANWQQIHSMRQIPPIPVPIVVGTCREVMKVGKSFRQMHAGSLIAPCQTTCQYHYNVNTNDGNVYWRNVGVGYVATTFIQPITIIHVTSTGRTLKVYLGLHTAALHYNYKSLVHYCQKGIPLPTKFLSSASPYCQTPGGASKARELNWCVTFPPTDANYCSGQIVR